MGAPGLRVTPRVADVRREKITRTTATVPEPETIRFARGDGTVITVTSVTLDIALPGSRFRSLEVWGRRAGGGDAEVRTLFTEATGYPAELLPLVRALAPGIAEGAVITEVIRLREAGMAWRGIAQQVGVSEKTVKRWHEQARGTPA